MGSLAWLFSFISFLEESHFDNNNRNLSLWYNAFIYAFEYAIIQLQNLQNICILITWSGPKSLLFLPLMNEFCHRLVVDNSSRIKIYYELDFMYKRW